MDRLIALRWMGCVCAWVVAGCASDAGNPGTDTRNATEVTFVGETRDTTAETVETGDSTAETTVTEPAETVAETVAETTVAETTATETTASETVVTPEPSGDDCDAPKVLVDDDLDGHYDTFADIGALSKLRDDYDAVSCGITDTTLNGHAKADAVWRFVAPADGEYRVSLLADTNIDLILYVFDADACGTTCLGFNDSGGAADIDKMNLTLTKNQAISVVVDGKTAWHAGAYIVDVYACGAHCD